MLSKPTLQEKLDFPELEIPLREGWFSSEIIKRHNNNFLPELILMRSEVVKRVYIKSYTSYTNLAPVRKKEYLASKSELFIFAERVGGFVKDILKEGSEADLLVDGNIEEGLKLGYFKGHTVNRSGKIYSLNLRIERTNNVLNLTDLYELWTKP